MRGVLLDPRTGRPEEFSRAQEEFYLDRLPPHIHKWVKRSRQTTWAGPRNDRQLFRTRISPDMLAAPSAVSPAAATETALFAVSTWAGIPALAARSGQGFELTVIGTITTPSTSGTLIITPRYGTSTSGVTLGASPAASATLTASKTASPFVLKFNFGFRTVNNTAASLTSGIGCGFLDFSADVLASNVNFGGTAATTLDTTTAQGFWIGLTFSVVSFSVTPQFIWLESLD